ncbi:MAG: phosphoribosylglycinamide formyltransferase [Acidobacteria bacterium]|nr:MAG: phosphoribosylglycinamide formyltransferase [Acidobacteriota bacterium]PYR81531.1 MAG: phosphoribosylglycinamide formyltransferase [Acidobacteriota bacterium]
MPESSNRRVGVLISGRGTNLQALIDAIEARRLNATIAVVISNRADAAGLQRARAAGIEAITLPHRAYATRDDYDRALVKELQARDAGLVCLAGFMRLVGEPLIAAFPNRILNIHPSLLPAFPGLDAQKQAIEYGVKVSGVTVHLVTAELDGGPIIVQRSVPVMPGDTADTLAARILEQEHLAYPEAVQMILDGGWRVDGRRFVAAKSPTSAAT